MRKLILLLSFLVSFSSFGQQVKNPYYASVNKNTIGGVTFLRVSWKPDRRDYTGSLIFTGNGSSTMSGYGAVPQADSGFMELIKDTLSTIASSVTMNNLGVSAYWVDKWLPGPDMDGFFNINTALATGIGGGVYRFPHVMLMHDASNYLLHPVSNNQLLQRTQEFADSARKHGAIAVILSTMPRTAYTADQKQQLEDMRRLYLARFVTNKQPGVYFVDLMPALKNGPTDYSVKTIYQGPEGMTHDLIHLNNKGHAKVASMTLDVIKSAFSLRPDILRHEVQTADVPQGPWTNYNMTVPGDTGYLNVPLTMAAKYFRVRTVYTNSTTTQWSNVSAYDPIVATLVGTKLDPPTDYYDFDNLSASEMGSGFHLENWFTGYASHDPKGNGMSITDTAGHYTEARPFRNLDYPKDTMNFNGMGVYPGDRGFRILFDWNRDKDINRLSEKTIITDIYGLQIGGDKLDTLYFYNWDKVMALPPHERPAHYRRPDLETPFAKMYQGTTVGFRPEWNAVTGLADSMRYMLVVLRKKQRSGYETYPNFSEIVFYGKKNYSDDAVNVKPWQYAGPKPSRKPFGQILGTNNVGVEESQLIYDPVSREYINTGNFIADTTAWPNEVINLNPWNYSTAFWQQEKGDSRDAGRVRYESIRGAGKRAEVKGGGNVGKSIPTTEPFMEPEDHLSYKQQADFYRHYAALFGKDANHTDGEFRFTNKSQLPGYGLNFFNRVEPGNEETTRGITWIATANATQMQYDGYEGEFKTADFKPMGVKGGDSTFSLVAPATVYADTMSTKVAIFLSKAFRNDEKVIFKWINGHHYPRKYPNPAVTEHDPTFEEQVGTNGATPEWDRTALRVEHNENIIWRETEDTSIRYVLTEIGYDNYSTPSPDLASLTYGPPFFALWTISPTPKVAGRDSLQGKGMLMNRLELRLAFTRMGWYNEYMITNVFFDPDNNYPGLFARSGKGAAGVGVRNTLIPTKFAHYWSRASFYNIAKDYVADTLLAYDSVGLCLAKYRHRTKPDSVFYAIWKGSWDGTTLSTQEISVGSVTGNATRTNLSFTSENTTNVLQAVSSNKIFIPTVGEEPTYYFLKEAPAATIIRFLLRKPGSN